MTTNPPWTLAIDFGTSFTVAAVKHDGRPPQAIDIDGDRRMPTVVHVDDDGTIHIGRVADDLASARPGQTLRAPKRRLGDPAPVVLGGHPYQVVDLVAAVLRHVCDEAVRHEGSTPVAVRLTHPATWSRPRLARLLEAAAKAGLPDPMLIAEPVAAAMSYASEVAVADDAYVAVYDLGGGTFDTTVLKAHDGRFTVVGRPGGDANLGGELFDELLVNMVGERLDPDVWEQLQVSDDLAWRQAAAALRSEVRRAKEALTAAPYAELLLPLPGGLVNQRLRRDELESIVSPYVEESVRVLLQCVRDADVEPQALAAVYLVGGASRMPIIERTLAQALGDVPVSRRGDPKTAVALGATQAEPSGSILDLQAAGGRITLESNPGPVGLAPPAPPARPAPPAPHEPKATTTEPKATTSALPLSASTTVIDSGATVVEPSGATVVDAPPASGPAPPNPPTGAVAASGPAAATGPRSRTPILVGAAVAVGLVLGAIAVVATRGGEKTAGGPPTTPLPATVGNGPGIGSIGSLKPATTAGPLTTTGSTVATSPKTTATAVPSPTSAPPAATTTAAPAIDPAPDALTAAEVNATPLTLDEVNSVNGNPQWVTGTYQPSTEPFCGLPAPDAALESHTVASRGSGLDYVEADTSAYSYATVDDLVLNYEAVLKAANECPVPTLVNGGITFTIKPSAPVERSIPLVDRAVVFLYSAEAAGYPSINQLVGIVAKGRSAVVFAYGVLGHALTQSDVDTATKLFTLLATKLVGAMS